MKNHNKILYGIALLGACFLFAFFFFAPRARADITTGMVGHWTFDEGSGTTATDSSGNGNNGTLMNEPVWTTDSKVGGGAMSFDGLNDYVNMPAITLTGTTFSYSFWMKAPTSDGKTRYPIDWGLKRLCQFRLNITNNFQCTVTGSGTGAARIASGFDNNQWHHIVYSVNGNNQTIYMDGVVKGTGTQTLDTAGTAFRLGFMTNTGGSSNYFNGSLDDVRIYNRALYQSDVTELYNLRNGGSAPSSQPTLINGSCAITLNICTSGTFQDINDSATNYLWNCMGIEGGTTASCLLPISSAPDTVPPMIPNIQIPIVITGFWYVDSSVSTSGDGRSWATAWKNLDNVRGVQGGGYCVYKWRDIRFFTNIFYSRLETGRGY